MNIPTLTRTEISCLLYIECCNVDRGGLLENSRMNADDLKAIKRLHELGLLARAGRVPFKLIERDNSHYAELSDTGWAMAHELRRERSKTRGPLATKVFADIFERETDA